MYGEDKEEEEEEDNDNNDDNDIWHIHMFTQLLKWLLIWPYWTTSNTETFKSYAERLCYSILKYTSLWWTCS